VLRETTRRGLCGLVCRSRTKGSSGGRKKGVVRGVGQERLELGPSYLGISFVLCPLNSLLWYVPSSRYTWSSAPNLFLPEQIKDIIIIRADSAGHVPSRKGGSRSCAPPSRKGGREPNSATVRRQGPAFPAGYPRRRVWNRLRRRGPRGREISLGFRNLHPRAESHPTGRAVSRERLGDWCDNWDGPMEVSAPLCPPRRDTWPNGK
jgi:hypothetical protein